MKRNIFRLLLSAVLMMCCTVMANAQLGTPRNDEIWYTTTDGQICEMFYDKGMGANFIDNKYENGRGTIRFNGAVTNIIGNAFYRCSTLASAFLPGSVTKIGQSAFEECTNLTFVSIPSNVTSIGNRAFELCTSLSSIFIPNGVTSIGENV